MDLRWNFLAAVKAQQGQRASGIPAPTGDENGRCECRLFENRLHRFRLKKLEDIGKRETVLLAQSNVKSVIGGSRLQLEVEAAAETLAQG